LRWPRSTGGEVLRGGTTRLEVRSVRVINPWAADSGLRYIEAGSISPADSPHRHDLPVDRRPTDSSFEERGQQDLGRLVPGFRHPLVLAAGPLDLPGVTGRLPLALGASSAQPQPRITHHRSRQSRGCSHVGASQDLIDECWTGNKVPTAEQLRINWTDRSRNKCRRSSRRRLPDGAGSAFGGALDRTRHPVIPGEQPRYTRGPGPLGRSRARGRWRGLRRGTHAHRTARPRRFPPRAAARES